MGEGENTVTERDTTTREGMPWYPAFLAALAEMPVVRAACEAANISRQTAYRNRSEDPTFARLWDEAMEHGWDKCEREAIRRAVEGYEEHFATKDGTIGTRRVYSDRLLEVILKGPRGKRYSERQLVELTGKDGGPLAVSASYNAELATRDIAEIIGTPALAIDARAVVADARVDADGDAAGEGGREQGDEPATAAATTP